MEDNSKAIFFALLTIILWGTTAAVTKMLLGNISNIQLLFYITLSATISTLAVSLFYKKTNEIIALVKNQTLPIFLLGFFGLGVYQYCYVTSFANAPTASVNVLNYMWPILIYVFSIIILKDKLSWKHILSLTLGLLGVVIVITKGQFVAFENQYLPSYMMALIAAFCWAIFSVINKQKGFDPISSVTLYNFSALILMFLLMLIKGKSFIIPQSDLIGSVYIGVFPTAIAFITWIKALHLGKASMIANLGHLTPFISLVFIFLLLKEKIYSSEIIGLIVIVSGILIQILRK